MPIMLWGWGSENLSRCYLWDQLLVWGKCCWSPNSDTYCYCPLESDYADHSWNNIAVTSDLTSFKVNDMFPGWTWKYVCIPQTNIVTAATNWTILFWVYPRFKNNNRQTVVSEATTWNSYNFNRWYLIEVWMYQNSLPGNWVMWWESWWAWDTRNFIAMRHKSNWYIELWINWVAPTSWGKKYWVDWEISINNYPMYFWRHVVYTSSNYPYWLLWQMRDIIVEKKYREDDEISNFYNCFKSKFWL